MSDADLRELERRWQETNALADHVAYLRARKKLGPLAVERLDLAAYLGHEAARLAVGPERFEALPALVPDLRDWVLGLERWGIEASVRAAVAAVRLILPADEPAGAPSKKGLRAAEALLACPCDKHEKAARIAWTQDAGWSSEIAWAELSADAAWHSRWVTSEEDVRVAITERLLPWALGEEGPAREWDAPGTGGD